MFIVLHFYRKLKMVMFKSVAGFEIMVLTLNDLIILWTHGSNVISLCFSLVLFCVVLIDWVRVMMRRTSEPRCRSCRRSQAVAWWSKATAQEDSPLMATRCLDLVLYCLHQFYSGMWDESLKYLYWVTCYLIYFFWLWDDL